MSASTVIFDEQSVREEIKKLPEEQLSMLRTLCSKRKPTILSVLIDASTRQIVKRIVLATMSVASP